MHLTDKEARQMVRFFNIVGGIVGYQLSNFSMPEFYKYRYTKISIFGSLPTHKVFVSNTSNKSKLVFADNTFIYGTISDWTLGNSDFDSRASTWLEEPKAFLEYERRKLSLYRASCQLFKTETCIG
jgi:hypothetical protein